jgi:hypothetical protein
VIPFPPSAMFGPEEVKAMRIAFANKRIERVGAKKK